MTFTDDQVYAALVEAVNAKGADYIYITPDGDLASSSSSLDCRYSDYDGNPSCIVGHVVAALDPDTFEKVVRYEAEDGESFPAFEFSASGYSTATAGFRIFTSDQAKALYEAQVAQDGGKPWGEALERFEAYMDGDEN